MAALTESAIHQALDWAYDKAVNGVPGLDSAVELAAEYAKQDGTLHDQANALIRWQIAKCATSGFVTGLGGLMTLPVAIPANITSVLYVQVRMIAAIAHLGGHDIKDDRVKTLVYTALCGNAALPVLKEIGVKVGTKVTQKMIQNISKEVIISINKAVGFRLLTKFGSTGVINLGKAIPLVGGIVGGTVDGVATNTIGNVARDLFIAQQIA
ncbi:EcsC family protein [Azospirillum sp.]|uniref:EcsC family protein n=1 Tax=Azospirillum sp. TaxID=34012 RepID=UPI002D4E737C|nr:EcsC family protein [Azospirillum sp.]HYF85396.1 EcsC family protein [Azospirillum sp.]